MLNCVLLVPHGPGFSHLLKTEEGGGGGGGQNGPSP